MTCNINGYTSLVNTAPIRRIGDDAQEVVLKLDMAHKQRIQNIYHKVKVGIIFGLAAAGIGAIMVYAAPVAAGVIIGGKILMGLGAFCFATYSWIGISTRFNEYRNQETVDLEDQQRRRLLNYQAAFVTKFKKSTDPISVPTQKEYDDLVDSTLKGFAQAKDRQKETNENQQPLPPPLLSQKFPVKIASTKALRPAELQATTTYFDKRDSGLSLSGLSL